MDNLLKETVWKQFGASIFSDQKVDQDRIQCWQIFWLIN